MHQLSLFDETAFQAITNVASIPQRSPFRYPGGKTWLVPHIRKWLRSLPTKPRELIEPFAGGGIVSLTVAFERLASGVTMVELDDGVAAVWQTILNGNGEWLANQIATFEISPESVELVLSQNNTSLKEKAFKTIIKNRVNRGGILAPGAGKIQTGENGKGLKSRWYPETLKRRIINIVENRAIIKFIEGDGLAVMAENINRTDAVFFIDPPYTAAGKKAGSRLYRYWQLNHQKLFELASNLAGDFLMTYDDTEEIRQRADFYGFEMRNVAMKNTHHAKMMELLIGKNLDWLE